MSSASTATSTWSLRPVQRPDEPPTSPASPLASALVDCEYPPLNVTHGCVVVVVVVVVVVAVVVVVVFPLASLFVFPLAMGKGI